MRPIFVDWIIIPNGGQIPIYNVLSNKLYVKATINLLNNGDNRILNGHFIYWNLYPTAPVYDKYVDMGGRKMERDNGYRYNANVKYTWEIKGFSSGSQPYCLYRDRGYAGMWINESATRIPWTETIDVIRIAPSLDNSFKLYDISFGKGQNEVFDIQYNLKPCFYNGEYGLWDTISNTFYGNSGTGTITGGYDE